MEAKLMRELRRKKQELSLERTEQILKSCTHGVLGVIGDGGYPYTVPMSYAYHDKKKYLHCAKAGHKLDAVENDDRVSFCAVARDDVLEEGFTTKYESAIAFGRARVLMKREEIFFAMRLLAKKYCAVVPEEDTDAYIDEDMPHFYAVCIDIEHMTGKRGSELVKEEEMNRE